MRQPPVPKTAFLIVFSLILAAAAEGAWPFSQERSGVGGYLGVSVQNLTPALREAFDLEKESGVLVNGVQPGSPAEKAGIDP